MIIVRKDLGMRKGKMIAQGAHASVGALLFYSDTNEYEITITLDNPLSEWMFGNQKKICVGVNSEKELFQLRDKARKAGLPYYLVKDAGLTEFDKPTYTALAIGPHYEENINPITDHLDLL